LKFYLIVLTSFVLFFVVCAYSHVFLVTEFRKVMISWFFIFPFTISLLHLTFDCVFFVFASLSLCILDLIVSSLHSLQSGRAGAVEHVSDRRTADPA